MLYFKLSFYLNFQHLSFIRDFRLKQMFLLPFGQMAILYASNVFRLLENIIFVQMYFSKLEKLFKVIAGSQTETMML